MNGVQTRFKCKLDVKRCKRFVFPPSSLLPRSNALKTKAIRYFQTDRTLTRIVSPPLEKQNYTPAKWDIEKYVTTSKLINNDKSNVNWYFLRYADVLLLYAEALNEWKHGPTDEAYEAINMVRRRGFGNPSKTSICDLKDLNEEDFRKAVYQERAYELAFEGHRRMDLIRWGIYYETIQKTYNDLLNWWTAETEFNYVVYRHTVKGKHELFPIPQRDMDLMIKFNQNPNWE